MSADLRDEGFIPSTKGDFSVFLCNITRLPLF